MNSQSEIKAGDIVCLKSGGTEMVVGDCTNPILAICYWYSDATNSPESAQFHVAALRLVKSNATRQEDSTPKTLKLLVANDVAKRIHEKAKELDPLLELAYSMGLKLNVYGGTGWYKLTNRLFINVQVDLGRDDEAEDNLTAA